MNEDDPMSFVRLARDHRYLSDHKLRGRPILSAALQIGTLLSAARDTTAPVVLSSVAFLNEAAITGGVELNVRYSERCMDVLVGDLRTATASVRLVAKAPPKLEPLSWEGLDEATRRFRDWRDKECPLEFGPGYDVVRSVRRKGNRVVALVNDNTPADSCELIPVSYIDAIFQLLAFASGEPNGGGFPWTVRRVHVTRCAVGPLYCQIEVGKDRLTGDGRILSAQGEVVAFFDGIRLSRPSNHGAEPGPVYRIEWSPVASFSADSDDDARTVEVSAQPTDAFAAFVELCDQIKGALREKTPKLRVITRDPEGANLNVKLKPFAAAVGAMLRSLRIEYPRTALQWLNLPSVVTPGTLPPARSVPEASWIDSGWMHPVPAPILEPSGSPHLPGHWLVIGGLGAIARALAPTFPKLGCTNLTLLSRRNPSAEEEQFIASLSETMSVRHVRADITDERFQWPAGTGRCDTIVNAAGALDDALFLRVSEEQINKVWSPKIHAAHRMGEFLDAHPDATMVTFSSIAAVKGNRGQSVYAAANAYQDAYAEQYRCRGRRWYSLLWGLWDAGMGQSVSVGARALGYPILDADKGHALFVEALSRPPGAYVLIDLSTSRTDPAGPTNSHRHTKQEGTIPMTRTLEDQVCRALEEVLERPHVNPQDSPDDLGLDSMMAVEASALLADRGIEIEPADFFGHSTVREIADHAASEIDRSAASRTSAREERDMRTALHPEETPVLTVPRATTSPERFPSVAPTLSTPRSLIAPDEPAHLFQTYLFDQYAPRRPDDGALTRTFPDTLSNLNGDSPLDPVIDEISKDDRQLVAHGDYFYEPVVQSSRGSHIRVDGGWKLNLASYSYLGLIKNEFIEARAAAELRRTGTAAHGVRLLSGTAMIHRQLERRIAHFIGREDSIVFSSGYMANVATIAALVGSGDLVVGDSLNHASIVDGCRLSGADFRSYAHNDPRDLDRVLKHASFRRVLVVTDAVFSMDGDVADLPAIVEVCRKHRAALMVDEAHSIGVLGATGRGVAEHFGLEPDSIDVSMGTLSKAIPSAGGYVSGSNDLVFALKNSARGWMFSAAIPPAQAAAADAAFELIAASPERVSALRALTERYRSSLQDLGLDTMHSTTPVVPVRCGTSEQALALAKRCQERDLFVQPITYPTVPKLSPRLRTIVNLSHTVDDLKYAVSVIATAAREISLIS